MIRILLVLMTACGVTSSSTSSSDLSANGGCHDKCATGGDCFGICNYCSRGLGTWGICLEGLALQAPTDGSPMARSLAARYYADITYRDGFACTSTGTTTQSCAARVDVPGTKFEQVRCEIAFILAPDELWYSDPLESSCAFD